MSIHSHHALWSLLPSRPAYLRRWIGFNLYVKLLLVFKSDRKKTRRCTVEWARVSCSVSELVSSFRLIPESRNSYSPSITGYPRLLKIQAAKLWSPHCLLQPSPVAKNGKNWKSKKKRICSQVSVNSPRNPCSQSWRIKGRLWWEGFEEKEGFKPGVMEY